MKNFLLANFLLAMLLLTSCSPRPQKEDLSKVLVVYNGDTLKDANVGETLDLAFAQHRKEMEQAEQSLDSVQAVLDDERKQAEKFDCSVLVDSLRNHIVDQEDQIQQLQTRMDNMTRNRQADRAK